MFPDGMTVRIMPRTAFEPDALVVCPSPSDLNTMEIPNPVIVVEVLSPSTAADDHGVKLDGYFSVRSIEHYLIIDADRRIMIHHKRGRDGAIETRILRDGVARFDPPGFEAEVAGSSWRSDAGGAVACENERQMHRPPSISSTTPVKNAASSLAR